MPRSKRKHGAALEAWGQKPERIRTLRERVEMVIYTPGSSSGIPVNVLASFEPPGSDDVEARAERAQTTASSLLGLLRLDTDPLKSRGYILLSALISHEWEHGRALDLPTLIERIQNPPFSKVGVLDLETFYPAKDRFAFIMAINNLSAAPSFATWRQGDPLDVAKFLYAQASRDWRHFDCPSW